MKYSNWLKIWLDNYVKPSTKYKTYMRYYEIVNQTIINNLGDYELKEIDNKVVQLLITKLLVSGNKRTGKGLASSTVNTIITVIQSSIKMAYEIGECQDYHIGHIKRPKIPKTKVECFSKEEQKKIENAVINSKNKKMLGILIVLYTGLRIGELLALKWKDIDFETMEISITKTCYDGKDKNGIFSRIINEPKTNSSIRRIPFPKQILKYFKLLKKESNGDYVVGGKSCIFIRSYQRSFELLLKKLDIQHRGFHSLRHTFATRALECGMDVKTLSELLGHQNATITLNRYVHSLMEHKKIMINNLGKLL